MISIGVHCDHVLAPDLHWREGKKGQRWWFWRLQIRSCFVFYLQFRRSSPGLCLRVGIRSNARLKYCRSKGGQKIWLWCFHLQYYFITSGSAVWLQTEWKYSASFRQTGATYCLHVSWEKNTELAWFNSIRDFRNHFWSLASLTVLCAACWKTSRYVWCVTAAQLPRSFCSSVTDTRSWCVMCVHSNIRNVVMLEAPPPPPPPTVMKVNQSDRFSAVDLIVWK